MKSLEVMATLVPLIRLLVVPMPPRLPEKLSRFPVPLMAIAPVELMMVLKVMVELPLSVMAPIERVPLPVLLSVPPLIVRLLAPKAVEFDTTKVPALIRVDPL